MESHKLDLQATDAAADVDLEHLPEGSALATFSTASSATTASCPISSAGSVMTANCAS